MRASISALLFAVAGCSPDEATPWRTCEDAYSQLERPAAPEWSPDLRPIARGARLPVVETTAIEHDAESLANTALALACVLTDDTVEPTDALLDWAEIAVTDPYPPSPDEPVFNVDLVASYRGFERAPSLEVRVVRPPGWRPAPSPDEDLDGIGAEASVEVASGVLARLAEVGLISELDYPVHGVRAIRSTECSATDGCSPPVTRSYVVDYFARHAGIVVAGARLGVYLDADGSLDRVSIPVVRVEAAGEATAVLSEADAAERFDMLMQARWPDRTILEDMGDVVYLLRPPGAGASAPVWLEAFGVKLSTGAPQRVPMTSERKSLYSLSLTDSDAVPVIVE